MLGRVDAEDAALVARSVAVVCGFDGTNARTRAPSRAVMWQQRVHDTLFVKTESKRSPASSTDTSILAAAAAKSTWDRRPPAERQEADLRGFCAAARAAPRAGRRRRFRPVPRRTARCRRRRPARRSSGSRSSWRAHATRRSRTRRSRTRGRRRRRRARSSAGPTATASRTDLQRLAHLRRGRTARAGLGRLARSRASSEPAARARTDRPARPCRARLARTPSPLRPARRRRAARPPCRRRESGRSVPPAPSL